MNRNRLKLLLALLVGLLVFWNGSQPPVAAVGTSANLQLLQQANEAFHRANDLMVSDPKAARGLFRKALLRYRRLTQVGVENGKLYYDIGNAYFRLGELGQAILNYRRAQRFIPEDENLRQNIAYALGQRQDKIEPKTEELLFKTLFFWHYDLSTQVRAFIFAFFYLFFWIGAVLLIWKRKKGLLVVTAAALFGALLFLSSLLFENLAARKKPAGVITASEIIARKGDSESYQPSFQGPLHAGTEFKLEENRQQWLYIELEDGHLCWVPAKAAELVVPGSLRG